jgi:RHH-type transcriptional regulator, proline utilization regulon repressor / proline dehydrogenase / delta 1-pyrroline-5-carboxylate dehydrogenase
MLRSRMTSPYERGIDGAFAILEAARAAQNEADLVPLSVDLARFLLEASVVGAESYERERAERIAQLLDDPVGQAFVSALTDRAHRSTNGERLLEQVRDLMATLGIPRSLSTWDKLELRALRTFGSRVPELTARAVRRRIDQDAKPYLAPAEPERLDEFLSERRRQGLRANVNHLGEEVLGEADAARMLEKYTELLARPGVDTISVKLSSIDSRIDLVAWDETLSRLSEKLARIYRAALGHPTPGATGGSEPKLVYLDMEAYRDLELTVELFERVLSRPELLGVPAGIVLQAYVPDSHRHQARLVDWARERVAKGGAPIRMRLVKGANLMMERIESGLTGLELPTYASKHDVDASFKRMLRFGALPKNAACVRLGIGSHNLFDIAYTLVLRAHHRVEDAIEPEMLEGMADPLRRVVVRVAGRVLVYAPSVDDRDFPSAVAYLVRRLDENTSEENFLRRSFSMGPGDTSFEREGERFVLAARASLEVSDEPRRNQNRVSESGCSPREYFDNEPDTDFTRAENRAWLRRALEHAARAHGTIVSRVAGKELPGRARPGFDPSRPGSVPYEVSALDRSGVLQAIEAAHRSFPTWAAVPAERREELLLAVAEGLRRARGELVGLIVLDAGKRPLEADIEVSEAIDFAEYYARQHRRLRERLVLEPKGLTVVTPPWNFPLSIGLGGALAALAVGNAVLVKPSPETPLVLARALEVCWRAGVPEEALGLVLTDDDAAEPLVTDPHVKTVVLTGGTETARLFRRLRPTLDLVAETGGKNVMIVSAMSDREQAVTHVVRSAFGHAGQKCSALSLLILEREVFRSRSFRKKLADAVLSLKVGSAWELESFVTPLIRPPGGPLLRALSELDDDESWLVPPSRSNDNERLVGPGVRWGVARGSFTHQVELFGPVLGVMEADGIEHAIELANATPFGLTAGLQSLDASEQGLFLERVNAGNLYVNRPVTGAIVGRQPFGGRKDSSLGSGVKAGGPNTLLALARVEGDRPRAAAGLPLSRGPRVPPGATAKPSVPRRPPPELGPFADLVADLLRDSPKPTQEILARRLRSYEHTLILEMDPLHPQDDVLGHEDLFVYQPARVAIVALRGTTEIDLLTALLAAHLVSARADVYLDESLSGTVVESIAPNGTTRFGSVRAIAGRVAEQGYERLRLLDPSGEALGSLAAVAPLVDAEPVSDSGYVELRRYVLEQTRSIAHHRYGNLSLYWALQAAEKSRKAREKPA